ncbi:UV radiation resistance protein and autophagy-related subunit 14-domain-containing protein, partial [Zopfochytrium polystomum]
QQRPRPLLPVTSRAAAPAKTTQRQDQLQTQPVQRKKSQQMEAVQAELQLPTESKRDVLHCGVCYSTHRKFETASAERSAISARLDNYLAGRSATGIRSVDEVRFRQLRLKEMEEMIAKMRLDIARDRGRIASMKENASKRRTALEAARSALRQESPALLAPLHRQVSDVRAKYKSTATVLVQSRRLLVRELVSVFRLRVVQRNLPGQKTAPAGRSGDEIITDGARDPKAAKAARHAEIASNLYYNEPQEYRIINVGFSTYGDYREYPREKFNAGIGHVVHMIIILSHYLGVSLPYLLVYRGSKSAAKPGLQSLTGLLDKSIQPPSQLPLYLTDENLDMFTIGLSMLNYDIAYLCHSQGVEISLHQVANTLENIALCCRAPKLGQ